MNISVLEALPAETRESGLAPAPAETEGGPVFGELLDEQRLAEVDEVDAPAEAQGPRVEEGLLSGPEDTQEAEVDKEAAGPEDAAPYGQLPGEEPLAAVPVDETAKEDAGVDEAGGVDEAAGVDVPAGIDEAAGAWDGIPQEGGDLLSAEKLLQGAVDAEEGEGAGAEGLEVVEEEVGLDGPGEGLEGDGAYIAERTEKEPRVSTAKDRAGDGEGDGEGGNDGDGRSDEVRRIAEPGASGEGKAGDLGGFEKESSGASEGDAGRSGANSDFATHLQRGGAVESTFEISGGIDGGADGVNGAEGFKSAQSAARPAPVSADGVLDVVGSGIRMSLGQGGKVVRLHLFPEHLGELQIKITGDDDSVSARIVVESAAVRDLIVSDTARLRELFAEQGLVLNQYSVEVGHDGAPSDDRGWAGAPVVETPEGAGEAGHVVQGFSTASPGSGRLDIFA